MGEAAGGGVRAGYAASPPPAALRAATSPLRGQGDRIWRLANAWPRGCPEPLVFVSHRRGAVHLLLRSKPVPGFVSHHRGAVRTPPRRERAANQIQSICNGKCDGNYNARPCDGERKTAGAGTMASNGKNNAQSNGNSRKFGRVLTHRLVISTPHKKQSPAAERRGRIRPRLGFQP